jgi:hypothetical protein
MLAPVNKKPGYVVGKRLTSTNKTSVFLIVNEGKTNERWAQ